MQVLVPTQKPHLPLRSSTHRAYTHIPGTHMYLKIPSDFQLSMGYPGIEAVRKQSQIRVKELKGQSFMQNGAQFSEGMLAPGQKLISAKEVEVSGFQARMLKFSYTVPSLVPDQNEQMISNLLALGDDRYLVLVIASYPSFREKELGKAIEDCMLGLTYDPGDRLKMSKHTLASFEINCQPMELELAQTKTLVKEEGNSISLIFTKGGEALSGKGNQHRLLVSENHWKSDPKSWPERAVFPDNFFSTYEAIEVQEVFIDGMKGLETWAIERNRQLADQQKLAYHVVLFSEESHFEIRAYAQDDEIYHLSAFREVCNSFRRR
ncbi:MAG: hypothetical protein AAFR87_24150 [Bacteroidota bacterium]